MPRFRRVRTIHFRDRKPVASGAAGPGAGVDREPLGRAVVRLDEVRLSGSDNGRNQTSNPIRGHRTPGELAVDVTLEQRITMRAKKLWREAGQSRKWSHGRTA
jgi:hypothetical protein